MGVSIQLPGSEGLLRNSVTRLLEHAGRRGLTPKRLLEELGSDFSRADLLELLAQLETEGEAIVTDGTWRSIRHTTGVVGQVQQLSGEDALIRTGQRSEVGYFVRRKNLEGARDGDTVLIKPIRGSRDGSRGGGSRPALPLAAVTQVLQRGHELLVGTLDITEGGRVLVPFDTKMNLEVEVEGGEHLLEDHFVVVELLPGKHPSARTVRGRVVEVLGRLSKPGVDGLVILRHFGIPEPFPDAVLQAASALPEQPSESDRRDREDLRQVTMVTIDGETARDFDDAISVERRESGGYRLGVHIADVSHYVEEGSILDLEAYRRGTSVYFPERAIPMLPESLSAGLCSLRPAVPRLTLTAILDFSATGELIKKKFCESLIESRQRLTYEDVRRHLEGDTPSPTKICNEAKELLAAAAELMDLLLKRRVERGSIDFDLPEGDVILDQDGVTIGVRPTERTIAHRIIEEFMIAANEAVASELEGHDCPALHRVHDPPTAERLGELKEILTSLGIKLTSNLEARNPAGLQAALRRVEGREEEPFVASLVLRAMQRALYDPESRGHFALSADHYTHFTSPIRRYPDLLVHRRLKALLAGRAEREAERTLLPERLGIIAERCSMTERRAERAERALLHWKVVRLLSDRVGERFEGRITGVQSFGIFVQLVEYAVDGLVPARSLSDDRYEFDPAGHRLLGVDTGRSFRLGARVEVTLTNVDLRRRMLDFRIGGAFGADTDDPSRKKGRDGETGRRDRTPRRRRRRR